MTAGVGALPSGGLSLGFWLVIRAAPVGSRPRALPRRGVFIWSIRNQFYPRVGWVPTRGRNRRLRPPPSGIRKAPRREARGQVRQGIRRVATPPPPPPR